MSNWSHPPPNGLSAVSILHSMMTQARRGTLSLPLTGRVFSVVTEEPREPLHWLALLEHELSTNVVIYSRLSPQRLGQHIKLNRIEFKWLSENMDPHALSPSLERIHHAISTRISTDQGIIWVDGVEYLIHRQGFDAFLSFTRSLADELSGTDWTVLLPYSPLSLEPTEIAHLRREAIPFSIPKFGSSEPVAEIADEPQKESVITEAIATEIVEHEEPVLIPPTVDKLKLLSTISKASFTPAVLTRRIEQWTDMGFDVSELEYAFHTDKETGYSLYQEVEERIRRAVECERRIQMIEIRGHLVEATKMRFRILQLTGLDSIEARLDELLSGAI